MSDELPAIEIEGRAVSFFAEYQRHEPYHESCIRSATEADLSALLAGLSPEQRERVLGPWESERLRDYESARQAAREAASFLEAEVESLRDVCESERTIRLALEDALAKADACVRFIEEHGPTLMAGLEQIDANDAERALAALRRSRPAPPPPTGEGSE